MSTAPKRPATPPGDLQKPALERVRRLLTGRLQRGNIRTSRPEWYFQAEADKPEAYSGGWQVRVRTWRHWSDARVHLDADSGEVMYRCVDRLAAPPTAAELDQDDALRIAAGLITIPRDARLRLFTHEQFADGHKVAKLDWDHYVNNVRVDGDYLWVMIQPQTHRLVAFGRKWRAAALR